MNCHISHDDCKPSSSLKRKYSYLDDNDVGRVHHPEKDNTVFATFTPPKGEKKKLATM
jgi:hypothetical protein